MAYEELFADLLKAEREEDVTDDWSWQASSSTTKCVADSVQCGSPE
jgi:hypothetical protein